MIISENTPQPPSIQNLLHQGLLRAAHEVARDARSMAPSAFGLLARSIQVQEVDAMTMQVIAGTDYASAVELGRKPGPMPSVRNIRDWLQAVGGDIDMAFPVAYSIGQKGTLAKPFMKPALEKNKNRIRQILEESVLRGLNAST